MFRRFASFKTKGYKEAQRLVPTTLRVTNVTGGTARKNVELKSLEVAKTQMIKIVNIRPVPGQEPEVVVQVVDAVASSPDPRAARAGGRAAKESGAAPKKKPTTKEIQISWSISENDLVGPKLTAITSVLSRGHSALVKFQNKRHVRGPSVVTKEHLESRQRLVDKLQQKLEPATCVSKVGTLENMLEMLFKAS